MQEANATVAREKERSVNTTFRSGYLEEVCEYPGRCYCFFGSLRDLGCLDLTRGRGGRRVRLSEVSKRPNYRSQLQNLVMLGWGDNNNDDAGLLRMLMIA